DINTGRWTTPDPVATPWWNLFDYCSAKLSRRSDPSGLDSPGCDVVFSWFFPERNHLVDGSKNECILECCAEHDYCFDVNNCSAFSWGWPWGACHECNMQVAGCMAACISGTRKAEKWRKNYYRKGQWYDTYPQSDPKREEVPKGPQVIGRHTIQDPNCEPDRYPGIRYKDVFIYEHDTPWWFSYAFMNFSVGGARPKGRITLSDIIKGAGEDPTKWEGYCFDECLKASKGEIGEDVARVLCRNECFGVRKDAKKVWPEKMKGK
ncbi:MAG: hypothetical protein LC130_24690, partial [Bryobacterales bacterium]|nr:hypothetical protein [Bryobacterales bacterium]